MNEEITEKLEEHIKEQPLHEESKQDGDIDTKSVEEGPCAKSMRILNLKSEVKVNQQNNDLDETSVDNQDQTLPQQIQTNVSSKKDKQSSQSPRKKVRINEDDNKNITQQPDNTKTTSKTEKEGPELTVTNENDKTEILNNDQKDGYQVNTAEEDEGLEKSSEDNTNHNDLFSPLPIIPRRSKYQEGGDSPMWKRRQLKLLKSQKKDQKGLIKPVMASKDSGSDSDRSDYQNEEAKKQQSIRNIQQRLQDHGSQIPIRTACNINFLKYPELFKYQIYECYKPRTVAQVRDYLQFLVDENITEDQLSPDLKKYLNNELDTKFPDYINQEKILFFWSNYECGNLDSAFLNGENDYNLLMKVDVNTKGNSYWFMYNVQNHSPGQTVKFTIMNFSRDISKFYNAGMNVLTRTETIDTGEKGPWRYDTCTNVEFKTDKVKGIVRSMMRDPNTDQLVPNRYFGQLSFKYKFKEEDQGKAVCFSYAMPYCYTQLQSDLSEIHDWLIDHGGVKTIKNDGNMPVATTNTETAQPQPTSKNQDDDPNAKRSKKLTELDELQKNMQMRLGREKGAPLSMYQIQHIEMRKQAILNQKVNEFEQRMYDNEIIKNKNMEMEKSFDITSDNMRFKQEVIALSVGGLNIYQLTLIKRRDPSQAHTRQRSKKCLYITARLHAAETHGSVTMAHIMKELVMNHKKYDELFNHFIIKLVPMINPDGVTIGNARSSLAGLDLNRRWGQPSAILHPEIYFLKREMEKQNNSCQGISIYCDLHGHNRRLNCFVFGCNKAVNEGILSWTKTRLLPKIYAATEPIFDYGDCLFKQDKHKLNTARVVVWNEMQVTNSFTLEISMFGKKVKDPQTNEINIHSLTLKDLNKIGKSLLVSIVKYLELENELEREFKETGGWLKFQKLKEFTGETARDKIERQSTFLKNNKYKHNSTMKVIQDHQQNFKKNPKLELIQKGTFNEKTKRNLSSQKDQTLAPVGGKRRKKAKEAEDKDAAITEREEEGSTHRAGAKDKEGNAEENKKAISFKPFVGSWRDFFDKKDFEKVFAKDGTKKAGKDEDEDDDDRSEGSDSEPSEDNYDQKEINQLFTAALTKEEITELNNFDEIKHGKQDQDDDMNMDSSRQDRPSESQATNMTDQNKDSVQYDNLQQQKKSYAQRIKILQMQLEQLQKKKSNQQNMIMNLQQQNQLQQLPQTQHQINLQNQVQINQSQQHQPLQTSSQQHANKISAGPPSGLQKSSLKINKPSPQTLHHHQQTPSKYSEQNAAGNQQLQSVIMLNNSSQGQNPNEFNMLSTQVTQGIENQTPQQIFSTNSGNTHNSLGQVPAQPFPIANQLGGQQQAYIIPTGGNNSLNFQGNAPVIFANTNLTVVNNNQAPQQIDTSGQTSQAVTTIPGNLVVKRPSRLHVINTPQMNQEQVLDSNTGNQIFQTSSNNQSDILQPNQVSLSQHSRQSKNRRAEAQSLGHPTSQNIVSSSQQNNTRQSNQGGIGSLNQSNQPVASNIFMQDSKRFTGHHHHQGIGGSLSVSYQNNQMHPINASQELSQNPVGPSQIPRPLHQLSQIQQQQQIFLDQQMNNYEDQQQQSNFSKNQINSQPKAIGTFNSSSNQNSNMLMLPHNSQNINKLMSKQRQQLNSQQHQPGVSNPNSSLQSNTQSSKIQQIANQNNSGNSMLMDQNQANQSHYSQSNSNPYQIGNQQQNTSSNYFNQSNSFINGHNQNIPSSTSQNTTHQSMSNQVVSQQQINRKSVNYYNSGLGAGTQQSHIEGSPSQGMREVNQRRQIVNQSSQQYATAVGGPSVGSSNGLNYSVDLHTNQQQQSNQIQSNKGIVLSSNLSNRINSQNAKQQAIMGNTASSKFSHGNTSISNSQYNQHQQHTTSSIQNQNLPDQTHNNQQQIIQRLNSSNHSSSQSKQKKNLRNQQHSINSTTQQQSTTSNLMPVSNQSKNTRESINRYMMNMNMASGGQGNNNHISQISPQHTSKQLTNSSFLNVRQSSTSNNTNSMSYQGGNVNNSSLIQQQQQQQQKQGLQLPQVVHNASVMNSPAGNMTNNSLSGTQAPVILPRNNPLSQAAGNIIQSGAQSTAQQAQQVLLSQPQHNHPQRKLSSSKKLMFAQQQANNAQGSIDPAQQVLMSGMIQGQSQHTNQRNAANSMYFTQQSNQNSQQASHVQQRSVLTSSQNKSGLQK